MPTRKVTVSDFLRESVLRPWNTSTESLEPGNRAGPRDYIFANDFLLSHPTLAESLAELGVSVASPTVSVHNGKQQHQQQLIQPFWMTGLPEWVGYAEQDALDATSGIQFYLGGWFPRTDQLGYACVLLLL